MMTISHALLLLMSTTLAVGQRGSFAGTKPIGFPELTNITTKVPPDGLGNRFGEGDATTQRLPLEALGDKDLVDRLSQLPIDKQPFWLINWQALEEQRKHPQVYPQRPSSFINPTFQGMNNFQNSNVSSGITNNATNSNVQLGNRNGGVNSNLQLGNGHGAPNSNLQLGNKNGVVNSNLQFGNSTQNWNLQLGNKNGVVNSNLQLGNSTHNSNLQLGNKNSGVNSNLNLVNRNNGSNSHFPNRNGIHNWNFNSSNINGTNNRNKPTGLGHPVLLV